RAEIADPRRAGAEPGQQQEQPAFGRDRSGLGELPGRKQDRRQRDQDDHGADQGREIGVDALDADLGEDRGQGREHGGQKRPDLPGRKCLGGHVTLFRRSGARPFARARNPFQRRTCGPMDSGFSLRAPRNHGRASIPVFRQRRQRRDLDAFVDQRARFLGRGLAVDR
ncbi:hypothetical protein chiPu_0033975, partial [Chiloscyllium punctatum]|nr:hypothetical protein [Chiloscyllium punctatum]